eukprot:TRINITY_DN74831_c0_g1_i1.p1 TRINITY_DN74831_c0_g1~~TRINITY_DN74831_c0_g1_i1.p1  ORF type:complete len:312 (+),score=56.71 TRINITY_DN74831_c0_g1_i1:32-967(+)
MARILPPNGHALQTAAWCPEPASMKAGAGRTPARAVKVSRKAEDVRLVTAAAEGHLEVVKACLPEVSSVNVHVRLARSSNSEATTPLHAASSSGHVEVVKLLLEWKADVTGGHGHLRALTPLYEAATTEVAALLLTAGASPDTREPDLVWYHKQRRRFAIAALVDARRAQLRAEIHAARQPRGTSPRRQASPADQERSRGIASIAPFARVEVAAARAAWRHVVTGSDGKIFECAICMSQVHPGEEALLLPCNASGRSGSGGRASAAAVAALPESRPHIFHFSCLEPWFLRKAGACPTCRSDLRRLLRQGAR